MKLLTQAQNIDAQKYGINGDFETLLDEIRWGVKEYRTSFEETIGDMDFPVSNENRIKLAEMGFFKIER